NQERGGVDIITDGEQRRESYSNRFATALEGVDIDNPGTALDRSGHPNPVPRIIGKIRRKRPVEVRDVEFLRANTDRAIKITVPGPFTMSQQAQNEFYKDEQEMVLERALPRCRPYRALQARRPIQRGRSASWSALPPAARPASSAGSWGNGCRSGWASNSWSRTGRGPLPYRHRGGGECRSRRPHAAHGEPDERGQRDALRQAQLHFIRDIAPVAGVTRVANVMVINSSFPAKTIPEFIAYAKANPDRITMASGGTGSSNQMSGELFKMLAGVLTLPMSFAHRYVRKDAHYDPARPHQQHAILRHRIAKIRGLRHASGDVVGYRSQLDPRRQLGPDIRVERRAGGLVLERPVDGAVLIVRE